MMTIKEAFDKIQVLRQNRINIFNNDDQALDVYNNDKDMFFKIVNESWERYEQNELFPPKDQIFEEKDIFKMIKKELKENPPHKEEKMMTEKEVIHHHLLNYEAILDELLINKENLKHAELKEIYDLLVNYWTKLD